MPLYSAYLLNHLGRFLDVIELECSSDEDAMGKARNLVGDHEIELWDKARFLARMRAGE